MKSKTPKKPIVVDNITFDSNEEVMIYYWLEDAIRAGLVASYGFHPRTYALGEPVKGTKTKYVFLKKPPFIRLESREINKVGRIVYTPDFEIVFTPKWKRYYPDELFVEDGVPVIIDAKGDFSRGANNTSGITFGIKATWLYYAHGVLVQKVKPNSLFKRTWIPEQCKTTRVRKTIIDKFVGYPSYEDARLERAKINELLKGIGL